MPINNNEISKEMLEISLCAQHNNGGLDIDLHWQTGVEGLFAVGEVAGRLQIVFLQQEHNDLRCLRTGQGPLRCKGAVAHAVDHADARQNIDCLFVVDLLL